MIVLKVFIYLFRCSSENHRYYNDVNKLVHKYNLKLLAGNFFLSEFKSCVVEVSAKLDSPLPQYVMNAVQNTNLAHYMNQWQRMDDERKTN